MNLGLFVRVSVLAALLALPGTALGEPGDRPGSGRGGQPPKAGQKPKGQTGNAARKSPDRKRGGKRRGPVMKTYGMDSVSVRFLASHPLKTVRGQWNRCWGKIEANFLRLREENPVTFNLRCSNQHLAVSYPEARKLWIDPVLYRGGAKAVMFHGKELEISRMPTREEPWFEGTLRGRLIVGKVGKSQQLGIRCFLGGDQAVHCHLEGEVPLERFRIKRPHLLGIAASPALRLSADLSLSIKRNRKQGRRRGRR